MPDEPHLGSLERIIAILGDADIPYLATGALVRNALGSARTSEDYDLVIDIAPRSIEDVRSLFESAGFSILGPLKSEFGTRLVIDLPGYEADLWIAHGTERDKAEFAHAFVVDYHGSPLRLMHPEDYVLRKLVNFTRIRSKQTDIDDAYQVLLHAWKHIDVERLQKRASGHRAERAARDLIDLVREDREALEAGRSPEE